MTLSEDLLYKCMSALTPGKLPDTFKAHPTQCTTTMTGSIQLPEPQFPTSHIIFMFNFLSCIFTSQLKWYMGETTQINSNLTKYMLGKRAFEQFQCICRILQMLDWERRYLCWIPKELASLSLSSIQSVIEMSKCSHRNQWSISWQRKMGLDQGAMPSEMFEMTDKVNYVWSFYFSKADKLHF